MDIQTRNLDPQSPFTLFLILVLLVLGQKHDLEEVLTRARAFLLGTKHSIAGIRSGLHAMNTSMEAFHANFVELNKLDHKQ